MSFDAQAARGRTIATENGSEAWKAKAGPLSIPNDAGDKTAPAVASDELFLGRLVVGFAAVSVFFAGSRWRRFEHRV